MMQGIGVDILKIAHLREQFINPSDPFARKVYTPAEMEAAEKREAPMHYYATRFAGKEAVFKALNLAPDGIRLNEIEILNDENGQPYVTLLGDMAVLAAQNGIHRVMVSLSYDAEYAIAYAVSMV